MYATELLDETRDELAQARETIATMRALLQELQGYMGERADIHESEPSPEMVFFNSIDEVLSTH
jgi:hypothetical protein